MNGYRCSRCGTLRRAREVVVGEGHQGIACREHPEAPVVAWDAAHEAALYDVDRYVSQGGALEDIDAFASDFHGERNYSHGQYLVALTLWRRWGGIPERRLPERTDEQKARELAALFG